MNHKQFVEIMCFPKEWYEWNMFPPELIDIQIAGYEVGHEKAPEHDRNGAFHWWIKKTPPITEDEIGKLYKLTYLDPDPIMAEDVRNYIQKLPSFKK